MSYHGCCDCVGAPLWFDCSECGCGPYERGCGDAVIATEIGLAIEDCEGVMIEVTL
jgi:hypothetical protein